MARVQLVAVVKIRWWVYAYIFAHVGICRIFRLMPNEQRLFRIVARGVTTEVETRPIP